MAKCTCGLLDPKQIRYARFFIACNDLLKVLEIINENCEEDEYLEILYDNIQKWIAESREVLFQYDLEEEDIENES